MYSLSLHEKQEREAREAALAKARMEFIGRRSSGKLLKRLYGSSRNEMARNHNRRGEEWARAEVSCPDSWCNQAPNPVIQDHTFRDACPSKELAGRFLLSYRPPHEARRALKGGGELDVGKTLALCESMGADTSLLLPVRSRPSRVDPSYHEPWVQVNGRILERTRERDKELAGSMTFDFPFRALEPSTFQTNGESYYRPASKALKRSA
ncbi:unnamed protein product, partial [Chrysoparadoxa australica]